MFAFTRLLEMKKLLCKGQVNCQKDLVKRVKELEEMLREVKTVVERLFKVSAFNPEWETPQ